MSDNEWQNEWIQMRVSKIEWFYVSKETKGQSGRRIRFLNDCIQFSMQSIITIRTSRSQLFSEIGILKFAIFTEKRLCWSLFFSKVASLEAHKFIKKRLQHRYLPVSIANLLWKFYLKNTTGGCFCSWNSPGIWFHKSENWWHIYFVSLL